MNNKITRIEINIGILPLNKETFEQSIKKEWYKIPQVSENAEIEIRYDIFSSTKGTIRAYDNNGVLQLMTNTYDYNHHIKSSQ